MESLFSLIRLTIEPWVSDIFVNCKCFNFNLCDNSTALVERSTGSVLQRSLNSARVYDAPSVHSNVCVCVINLI